MSEWVKSGLRRYKFGVQALRLKRTSISRSKCPLRASSGHGPSTFDQLIGASSLIAATTVSGAA